MRALGPTARKMASVDALWLASFYVAPWLVPPAGLLFLAALGAALASRRPLLSRLLRAAAWTGLALSFLPAVAHSLLALGEPPQTTVSTQAAQAIVVLGAGRYRHAPEYGGETVSALALERLRYAARLARQTGLPALVSGGAPGGGTPEAVLMARVLREEFGVPVAWEESRSRTTRENAVESRAILARHGVRRILLVTHAWHLARATYAFERAGFEVVPAGTRTNRGRPLRARDFVPDPKAVWEVGLALHEFFGLLWYRLTPWPPL